MDWADASEAIDRLVLALGPVGALFLLGGLALYLLTRAGYVRIGKPGETSQTREQPSSTDTPCDTCPAQDRLTVAVSRLEGVVERLDGDLAHMRTDVALHHRILITPDHGSKSVIERLVGLEDALVHIESILRRAVDGGGDDPQ